MQDYRYIPRESYIYIYIYTSQGFPVLWEKKILNLWLVSFNGLQYGKIVHGFILRFFMELNKKKKMFDVDIDLEWMTNNINIRSREKVEALSKIIFLQILYNYLTKWKLNVRFVIFISWKNIRSKFIYSLVCDKYG